jgi:hypothetical protein
MTFSLLTRMHGWLSAPPVVLPRYLDRLSEWWWRQPSRSRLLLPAVAVIVIAVLASATTTRQETVLVLVTNRDIAAGTVVTSADVTAQRRPRAYVPQAHTDRADGVAVGVIAKGSVLTRHHLTDGGASAQLPSDKVAVAVARDVLPPVVLGDTVTFVEVTFDGVVTTFASPAVLFHRDMDVLWFAVDPHDAALITAASQSGRIGVIVHPRRGAS